MSYKIVFSDVDGTLLNSNHQLLDNTLYAIRQLQQRDIPFVIISARSPSGIYPIQETYGFRCPIISYSGTLILDEQRKALYVSGLTKRQAAEVIDFIEENQFDCSWNIYFWNEAESVDTWIVKNKQDPRILREESIVHASAVEGTIHMLPDIAKAGKILCMCNPERILEIEEALKTAFPELSIAKSSDILLEIMPNGVTKSSAVETLCDLWNIPLTETVAFGDNYNDVEMLETVKTPFLMGNAPEELKGRFSNVTDSNDEDGIYKALKQIGLVS